MVSSCLAGITAWSALVLLMYNPHTDTIQEYLCMQIIFSVPLKAVSVAKVFA